MRVSSETNPPNGPARSGHTSSARFRDTGRSGPGNLADKVVAGQGRAAGDGQRGFIMLVVMVILMVMVVAGGYTVKALSSETTAAMKFRKSELLIHAAEAGADYRMSEIAVISDPNEVTDETNSTPGNNWTNWPPAGLFVSNDGVAGWTASSGANATLQYRTGPVTAIWNGRNPPPGVPAGTNTYIWQFTAYAVQTDLTSDGGEAAIDVGLKTWDRLPCTYCQ